MNDRATDFFVLNEQACSFSKRELHQFLKSHKDIHSEILDSCRDRALFMIKLKLKIHFSKTNMCVRKCVCVKL